MDHGRPRLRIEGNNGHGMERITRWCLMSCLRDLRHSVQRNRVMSLPNLLRLCRRRWWDAMAASMRTAEVGPPSALLTVLDRAYRERQPFRQGT